MINYTRRPTVTVTVGDVQLGGSHPVIIQSMTNTDTADITRSAAQCVRIARAGGQIVRLTAQGVKQAEAIGEIRQLLRKQGCTVPLVADIHFNPKAAIAAAKCTDKVRINPGNFVDPARTFKTLDYTDEEYALELTRLREALVPFIELCRSHRTAVRLGVNHGSLSDRIMSRYGNTAAGMVESAMEFLRVFHERGYHEVVVSMKASNVVVMVEAVRRVVEAMDREGMNYPLHLGVTEAGFGDDGRVKSAVGIGTLMAEGLGDTIRVSLSEEPEAEIPVAQKLVEHISRRQGHAPLNDELAPGYDPMCPKRRPSVAAAGRVGGKCLPVVVAEWSEELGMHGAVTPDFVFCRDGVPREGFECILPASEWKGQRNTFPLYRLDELDLSSPATLKWVAVEASVDAGALEPLRGRDDVVLVASPSGENIPGSQQSLAHTLTRAGLDIPLVVRNTYDDTDPEWLQVKTGADMGCVALNGMADGLWLEAPNFGDSSRLTQWMLATLQAARLRTTKTEFISCPGCGRTMFDLQTTVRKVQAATQHLTHLKIGVMGCVVNGPGEMADADYGYVGAAAHRISLYKGKTCIEKNIPESEAIERLIALIKAEGDWREP